MPIDDAARQRFEAQGWLRLEERLPAEAVEAARRVVDRVLERHGVARAGRWVGPREAGDDPGAALAGPLGRALKQATRAAPAFATLFPDELIESARKLVDGRPLRSSSPAPQLLFTPPHARTWTVPHRSWHLDVPRIRALGRPGVQLFAFLAPVAPGGGGTLVVAGSHRLLNEAERLSSKEVKRRLARRPYYRRLFDGRAADRETLLERDGDVDGVPQRVVELTGAPGDVVLTDLRVLHTLAPNGADRPRVMVTKRWFVEAFLAAAFAGDAAEVAADAG